ncbi:MAG: hypothetical protein QOG37_294 [Mycobacterium sp.]|nr:hypothetical protein [Mycobacterium sp.]
MSAGSNTRAVTMRAAQQPEEEPGNFNTRAVTMRAAQQPEEEPANFNQVRYR